MPKIEKVGLAVIRDGALLLCRPYAFEDLILPGGTIEQGESHIDNLRREIAEELGIDAKLNEQSLRYLGRFSDRAAGLHNRTVSIELYAGEVAGSLVASSEIKDLVWYRPGDVRPKLSPVVANKVIPFLLEQGATFCIHEGKDTAHA